METAYLRLRNECCAYQEFLEGNNLKLQFR